MVHRSHDQAVQDKDHARRKAEDAVRLLQEVPARGASHYGQGGAIWFLFVSLALVCAAWWNTFFEMWLRWFPAWTRQNMSLSERLSEGDSYYTHGPLVPLVSLAISFFIYRRVGLPANRTHGSTCFGWLGFGCGILMHLVSVRAGVMFLSGFSLIGVLGGALLLWGGWPLARAYWLPVMFLFFMVPLPMGAIAALNFKLKFLAGESAVGVSRQLFGIPVYMEGSFVHLPPGQGGQIKKLMVENVCSGLRSLISLTYFGSLFAVVCRARGSWRLFLLLAAVPVAVLSNIIRITCLALVAHYYSVKAAAPDGAFHDVSGILVFVFALAILFSLEWTIIQLGKLFKCNWTDSRLLGYLDGVKEFGYVLPRFRHPVVLGVLVVCIALSFNLASPSSADLHSAIAVQAVPKQVMLDGRMFGSTDHQLPELALVVLQTRDYLYRIYRAPQDRSHVELLIVFSANNRKGTHEPEVCLEGSGYQITHQGICVVDVEPDWPVEMREIITEKQGREMYHLYVYKAGDVFTTSFFRQQLTIFLNGLAGGRSGGALVRFDVPITGGQTDQAREMALAAVRELLGDIRRNLN
ncbi:MAG: EpsI family protein [Phycisphaeraceae bacterium]|nr:EpsI family protein [Phycisphaeraceae bacterium]